MGPMSCRCKPTVDKGLGGMAVTGSLSSVLGVGARLDSVCRDGDKCDICNIGKTLILSINL